MSRNIPELNRYLMIEGAIKARLAEWEAELKKNFGTVAHDGTRHLMYANNESIADAVYRKDTQFLEGVHDHCAGITKLKRTENYKFLKDVERDDVPGAIEHLDALPPEKRQDNNFFKFYGRDQRTYFLNAAHLASSPRMIAALGTRGIDFQEPDSEGRLPIFFIARHAKSRWAIPALCQIFEASARHSGDMPAHIKMPDILAGEEDAADTTPALEQGVKQIEKLQDKFDDYFDQPYTPVWDPPLIRAIKYRNRETILGLDMLSKGKVDWNQRFQWNKMTPLMYAVLRADEAVSTHRQWHEDTRNKHISEWPRLTYTRWEVAKALWMVKFLARHPQVDPHIRDNTGSDAKGYACTDSVQRALREGIKARYTPEKQQEKLFTAHTSRRFT